MKPLKNKCAICGCKANTRCCDSCYSANIKPCNECQKPAPSITRNGTQNKSGCCVSCTAKQTVVFRTIGAKCKICKTRSNETNEQYQVCKSCQQIEADCPACKSKMPKYRKRGKLRVYCSRRCAAKSLPVKSFEELSAIQRKRFENHVYKTHQNDLARRSPAYKQWRKQVFERDQYTCQDCGVKSGGGKTIELHPHHIKPFATHHELRYEISNGVTLCKVCHGKRHNHVFYWADKKGFAPVKFSNLCKITAA